MPRINERPAPMFAFVLPPLRHRLTLRYDQSPNSVILSAGRSALM
jgi:hypothetical protein